jgi:ferritin-like metal-binding protein YciE
MAKKPKLLSNLFHDTLKDVYFAENRLEISAALTLIDG